MNVVASAFRIDDVNTVQRVQTLRAMCGRHGVSVDRFVFLTDQDIDIADTECLKLAHDWPAEYARLELFRPIFENEDRILFIDLSCIVVDDLSEIFEHTEPLVLMKNHWTDVMIWTANELRDVYKSFVRNPRYDLTMSEWMIVHRAHTVFFNENEVGVYDGNPPGLECVTAFHGIKPWDVEDEWIQEQYQ